MYNIVFAEMPVAQNEVKSSWADEVEEEGGALPAPSEVYENGFKILTEYKYNQDNKKVKVVRAYKIERRIVSKTIAVRKNWAKFGDSDDDRPGPNPATTVGGEDVFMQFISSKEEENKVEEDSLDKLKSMGDKGVVKCRNCNGDHWTSKCPYKDTVLAGGKLYCGNQLIYKYKPRFMKINKIIFLKIITAKFVSFRESTRRQEASR